MNILLLDIDGVLVQPGGYREAVRASFNHFMGQFGLPNLAPVEEDIAYSESLGITNEWDIIPICLAIIIESLLEKYPKIRLPGEWNKTSNILRNLDSIIDQVDYQGRLQKVGKLLKTGISPSNAILDNGLADTENHPFPLLTPQPFFKSLFLDTKEVTKSITTSLFQNYVLGKQVYEDIYKVNAPVDTQSYLTLFDRPLISENNTIRIQKLTNLGKLVPVIVSTRPSLPPRDNLLLQNGFSPEAEMGMRVAGFPDIPCIAYGRLLSIARLFDFPIDLLIKPSPFHALSAILTGLLRKEYEALVLSAQICLDAGVLPHKKSIDMRTPSLKESLLDPLVTPSMDELIVHIIEDSPIGIQSCLGAYKLLSDLGFRIEIHLWGVAKALTKINALLECGATVYGQTDDVLQAILIQIN